MVIGKALMHGRADEYSHRAYHNKSGNNPNADPARYMLFAPCPIHIRDPACFIHRAPAPLYL
jgi:hypothetical protein